MAEQWLDVEESDMRLIPVKTDGGTRIENTLNQAQQTVENQSEKIEDQQIAQKYLSLSLSLAIFWLGVHIIFVVPSLVSIGTGTVLMAGLIYSYYRYLWE